LAVSGGVTCPNRDALAGKAAAMLVEVSMDKGSKDERKAHSAGEMGWDHGAEADARETGVSGASATGKVGDSGCAVSSRS
jgi:hypothetical protein